MLVRNPTPAHQLGAASQPAVAVEPETRVARARASNGLVVLTPKRDRPVAQPARRRLDAGVAVHARL